MHLQYILMIKHRFRITDVIQMDTGANLKMHPLVKLRMLQTSKKNRIVYNIFKRLWKKNLIKLFEESHLLNIYKTNKLRKII